MMRSRAELSQTDEFECVKKGIVAASVVIVLCSSMHLTGLKFIIGLHVVCRQAQTVELQSSGTNKT